MKSCGECQAPQTCGGGGPANVCGCIPTTCTGKVQRCGTIPDGCGGELNCGECSAPNHCGPLGACGVADNVIIYSNYAGGTFTINVDQDIPNLAIGIVAYDAAAVTITGPFAGNVVAVAYAGFTGAPATSIKTEGSAQVTIEKGPNAPAPGLSSIICGTGGALNASQGCNPREQVRAFFTNKFQAPVLFQKCQYAAYFGTLNVSAGGTCACEPTTCEGGGIECGDYPDGCGGTLNCGGCAAGTCGGMGVPNVCGGCAPGQILSAPRHPVVVANDKSIGSGSIAWTVKEYSTDIASISAMTGGASQYLKATGFGFALPANAVVGGIYAQWERKSLSAVGLMDNAVRIVKDGAVQGMHPGFDQAVGMTEEGFANFSAAAPSERHVAMLMKAKRSPERLYALKGVKDEPAAGLFGVLSSGGAGTSSLPEQQKRMAQNLAQYDPSMELQTGQGRPEQSAPYEVATLSFNGPVSRGRARGPSARAQHAHHGQPIARRHVALVSGSRRRRLA